jgi:glycerol-3-phosphate acyltransferase PlsX
MAIRIAVDAMGGDKAPAVVVEGAIRAVKEDPAIQVLLFGREDLIRQELNRAVGADDLPIQIVNATDVIEMGEAPTAAVKNKQGSSIHIGLGAHKQGKADAFVSAGNTGAVMAASLFILGRLPGVARPSVMGFFPTTQSYCVVLDVGTNVDCRAEHFVQFARMGAVYASVVMKRENPIIGLLNIGEERGKGNEQTKSAFDALSDAPGINFKGNVEGRELMHHVADVVVCDGFVGNVMLKFGESIATAFPHMVAEEMARQNLSDEEMSLVVRVLSAVRKRFNYEEYGGAPLLGVDGHVLIGHGGSSSRAVERMILTAAEEARGDVAGAIARALGK